MCTTSIQGQYKRNIKVKTKSTTKQLELVCGPFSTPTCAGQHYHILFIDDYTCFTFVWVPPDKKSKICTSAYHTERARKTKQERESEIEKARKSDTI
jgi:hypothetical protein